MKGGATPVNLPAVLALALGARLIVAAIAFHFHPVPPLSDWGYENIALARSLQQGHGFSSPFFSPSGPSAFMTPGYPLLIAGVIALFGFGQAASTALIALQILISVATLPLVVLIAREHFGQYTANLAAVIYAVALPVIYPTVVIWDTCLSALLLTLGVFAAPRLTPSKWALFLAGAFCALAGLINPALLPTLLVLLWLRIRRLRARPWAALAGFLIFFSPWPLRNATVMHAFIPFRSNFPNELWIGNHGGADGDSSQSMNPMLSVKERALFVRQGEVAYMNGKAALAKRYIEEHPGAFAALSLRRVLRFWSGSADVHLPTTAFLSVLAIVGLIAALRSRKLTSDLAVPLLLFPLPYYLTHADVRFQAVIDPLLVVLAAEGLALLLRSPNNSTSQADQRELSIAATSDSQS